MMHYAIPDCGVLTPTEMVEQAARVTEAISIPLIVDADQGGNLSPTSTEVFAGLSVSG